LKPLAAFATVRGGRRPLVDGEPTPEQADADHRTVSPGRKDDLAPKELARFKAYLAKR
jgi:hypothetical protein